MRLLLATLLVLAGVSDGYGLPAPQKVATRTRTSNVAITRGGGSVVGSTTGSAAGAMQLGLRLPGLSRTGSVTSAVSGTDNFASAGNGQVASAREVSSLGRIGSGGAQTLTRQRLQAATGGRAVTTGVGTGAASGAMRQSTRGAVTGPRGVVGAAGDDVATSATSSVTAQNSNQGNSLTQFAQNSEQTASFMGSLAGGAGGGVALPGGVLPGQAVPPFGGLVGGGRITLRGDPGAGLPGTTTTTTTTRRPRRRRRMMRRMMGGRRGD